MKKQLTIAMIVKKLTISGGQEKYAFKLIEYLSKTHKIDVYCEQNNIDKLNKNINVIIIQKNKFAFNGVSRGYFFYVDVNKELINKNYDIVHSHENGMFKTKKSINISTIHTFPFIDGMINNIFELIFYFYLSIRALVYHYLESIKNESYLCSASEIIKERWNINHNLKNKNHSIIIPGIDFKKFNYEDKILISDKIRKDENISNKKFIILFVGNDFYRKGLDYILPYLTKNKDCLLYVIGTGNKKSYFNKIVDNLKIKDQIIFTGNIKDVNSYFYLADILILPCRKEGFGMVILEAMASGLCVITNKNCGAAYLIENKKTGIVLDDNDQLIDSLVNLEKDKKLRLELGKNANQFIKNNDFSWNRMGKEYEELYYSLTK